MYFVQMSLYWIRRGSESNDPCKKSGPPREKDMHSGGRQWSDTVASQGTAEIVSSHQNQNQESNTEQILPQNLPNEPTLPTHWL